ncbi:DUF2341 domain-containing protein, partial [Candidatus Parcubacteria bacterium]|nr:DUF2341 domain-containing protein [Candidatus Parcubacteria bacterium]
MKKIKQNNYTFNSGKIANMRKTFKQKSISFLLVFLLAFQIIIGVLVPADISLFPPKLSIQETKAAGESWYDSNYTYRRAITIDHDQVATTTDAFPVLATTTQNYLKTTTNGGSVQSDSGHDIVFTDSDGQTLLNYEREKYSSSTGEIVYWINTDISSTSDKTIYMYYGNSSASDQATTTGVWDDNFVMVQHMNQTPTGTAPHMIDSTKYDNDGTASGTMTVSDQVAGQIDGSLDFDGGDDYIDVSPVLSINNLPIMTISMWVNTDSFGEDEQGYLLSKEDNGSSGFWAKLEGPYSAMEFRIDYDNIDLKAYSALGSFSSSDFNNWKYITITWDGTTNASDVHFYKDSIKLTHYTDGESDAIGSRVSDIGNNLYIGNKSFATRTFDGTIDEVRISNIVRHASWIKTEYNNQSDVASFLTFETQEDKPTENVFYSVSPFGTGDISNDSPSITIVDGVATLSQAQTGNIGTGVEIEYNSTKAYIAPNRIAFISGGTTELEPGTKIEGNTSGATGIIRAMETISGAWANGDATGWIYFEKTTGTFNASEQINRTKPTAVGSIVMTNGTIQGNIGNGNTEFVVKNATGATPTDQASTTVTSIHHVWGSLFDFEANFIGANYINNADLTATSTNVVAHAVCYYDHDDQTADVTAVDINFGTTSVDNYLQVYTPIGGAESLNKQRHNGTISSGYYIDPVAGGHGITNSASYSVFDGIRITDVESTYNKLFYNNAGEVTIKNCIFHDSAGASTDGVVLGAGYYNVYFYNNIIYNIVRYGLDVSGSVVSGYVYNNTVHNCAIGIYDIGAARTRLKNNISFGNSSSDYDDTAHADSTHNASDDGTAPNTNEITLSSFIVTDYFVSATDFHIDSSATYASEITDVGISLLNDSTKPFSADIDRQFHSSNIIWDIGADETATAIYRSVGPSKTTAVDDDNSNTETITIASGTATFSAVIADNVGVGDVILYDSSDDNNLTSADFIAFISARIDNQNYTIQTATGTSPADLSANDTWAIYRAYTSLANAESGTENTTLSDLGISYTGGNRDLVTNNEQWNIACYADAVDETAVIINDWTTGAQNYIKIYTPVLTSEVGISQRHNGVWDDGKYWSHNNDSATSMISIRDNYVRILGIQIQVTGTGINNRHGVRIDTVAVGGAEIYIDSMIIKGIFSGTGEGYGINNTSVNPSNVYIYNNLIYDFVSDSDIGFRGIRLHSGTNTYIYNNTIQNCYYGILRDGTTAYAKNNIVQNCTDGFSNGDFDPTSDYNISDVDQTDADHANATFDGYKTVKFIDLANNDFHLAPDDTVAIDAGTSTPGDSIASLQNDIDGDYRTQWDIGADEASIEFIGMVTEDDIGDNYSTLVSWETGMQTDLTATSTRVFSISGLVGTVSDISSVIGTSSGVTADVVHVSTTTNQILLENISGDFTDGEQLQVDGTNYVTITNLGNPAIAVARIDGAWTSADNNRVTISGWTTGEYNYIKIYTTDSARHNGKWDDGKYRMEVSMPGDGQRAIRVWEEYTRIDGLQIKMQSEYTSTDIVIVGSTWDSNNDFRISNSILQGDYTGNGQGNGISTMSSSKARGKIWNNIVYEITNGYAVTYRGWAYNNTAYNCSSGFNSNGYSPKGNIAQNCTNGFIGPFGASSDYNISDTSQADADDVNATFNGYKTVKFLDATNNDFHLHPDDTSAINAGTTTSALSSWSLSDRISLNYDIDGTLRGGAFDIGADEVPVEFISTICENTSAGGDCANLDYTSLGGTG